MKRAHLFITVLSAISLFLINACKEQSSFDHSNILVTLKPQYLSVSTYDIVFNSPQGSTSSFQVYSNNVDWTITDIPEWITIKPISGNENETVSVTVSENTKTTNRVGILSFKSADDSWAFANKITVSQYRAKYFAIPEKDRVEFDGSASGVTLKVTSNVDNWTVHKNASLTWCTATKGDGCINLSVTPNTGNSSRSGQIEISTADGSEYVTILQRPANISSTTASLEFYVAGGSKTIEISSEAPWVASTSCAWINVTPESGQAGNSTVSIQVTANNSLTTRSDYVYLVLSDERKIEIPVSQEAITFSVDKATFNAPASGQDFELSVQSNVAWKLIDSIASWIELSPRTGNGNNKITISVSANQSYNERNTSFKLAPTSLSNSAVDIAVHQNGITFDTDSTALHFSDKAGSAYFSITSDGTWTVNPSAQWIILDKASGSGNSKIKVSVTENTADSVRSGFIVASVDGKQDKIAVIQQGKYFNISSGALNFTSKGGSSLVTLKTNDSWTVNTSNDWITVSAKDGSQDCNLTITTTDNPSVNERSGYVDITPNCTNPVRVNINQSARFLTVSIDTLQFFCKGGTSDPVTILTDGVAEVTTATGWLTINKESATQFTLTATLNDSESDRTGLVVVSLNDLQLGSISKVIVVNQYVGLYNSHEFVDLGLSVKWATCNVGANNPHEYGNYYAWAEINIKETYNWWYYKYNNGVTGNALTKYNQFVSYGSTDDRTVLDADDDVANVLWGGRWRMPTESEFRELIDNCTWTWTTQNNINGYLITSNKVGFTDRTIFLPAAGQHGETVVDMDGECGFYWSSSIDQYEHSCSKEIYFLNSEYTIRHESRCVGNTVRPVFSDIIPVASVTLNKTEISMQINDKDTLVETVRNGDGVINLPVSWSSDNAEVVSVDSAGIITAHSMGTAIITVTCQSKTAECTVTVNAPVPEYVDLGLSVNWASFNIGASKPEEYGSYFAWAEISPKTNYSWATYQYHSSGDTNESVKISKYNTDSNRGTVDNKVTLESNDDVACVQFGANWRMPTKEEFDELRSNCSWEWKSKDNVNGYLVTSLKTGYTDKSIFLPAAGFISGTDYEALNDGGYYWSSSLWMNGAYASWNLWLDSDKQDMWSSYRGSGLSVRPVYPSETWLNTFSIDLETKQLTLFAEATHTLVPIVKDGSTVISYFPVTWSSSNQAVAIVDDSGVVTAVSAGTAIITALCKGKTSECTVTVKPKPEYVDLGLSVNWATFNVGAEKSEESGDYYSWGETETKSEYSWSNYKYCNGSKETLTKYNTRGTYGYVDNLTVLDVVDDVAHVKWGGNWRMPTDDEFRELLNNCSFVKTTQNDVSGYKITSMKSGFTDRSIFLPAAGYYDGTNKNRVGSYGVYWSSSLSTTSGFPIFAINHDFDFDTNGKGTGLRDRSNGTPIRPVCSSDTWINDVSITLDKGNKSMIVGAANYLSATVKDGSTVLTTFCYTVTWSSSNPDVASVEGQGKQCLVTAISPGTTTITAVCFGKTTTCTVTVTERSIPYEYVDLGLSVNWATHNVGAQTPEEYGGYYAWGETETKSNYVLTNYKYYTGGTKLEDYQFSKYNTSSSHGTVDNKTNLDIDDDVAHEKWGGSWRMPSSSEFEELINSNNCNWEWTTQNGVNGYKVSGNKTGFKDRSIFLPAGGNRKGTEIDGANKGYYWTNTLHTDYPISAKELYFDSNGNRSANGNYYRYLGNSIRPVMSKPSESEYVDLGLSVKWATHNIGADNPEDYGDYYAWGETETKTDYNWSTYKYCNGTIKTMTKYCTNSSYGYNGFNDSKDILDWEDDVAHVKWGGIWRMPTQAEVAELRNSDNCSWEWTTLNGVNGYRVTSKKPGYTDRSIFLPAAGYRINSNLERAGSEGGFWSISLAPDYYDYNPNTAWMIYFSSSGLSNLLLIRCSGLPVRPVCP